MFDTHKWIQKSHQAVPSEDDASHQDSTASDLQTFVNSSTDLKLEMGECKSMHFNFQPHSTATVPLIVM